MIPDAESSFLDVNKSSSLFNFSSVGEGKSRHLARRVSQALAQVSTTRFSAPLACPGVDFCWNSLSLSLIYLLWCWGSSSASQLPFIHQLSSSKLHWYIPWCHFLCSCGPTPCILLITVQGSWFMVFNLSHLSTTPKRAWQRTALLVTSLLTKSSTPLYSPFLKLNPSFS